MESRPRRNFALIWQAALIVLPLVILSAFSLYFLREDKAAINREARERAAALAPELAQRIGQRLSGAWAPQFEGTVASGRILSPPDYPRLPAPVDWVSKLVPDQAKLWKAAEEAVYQRKDPGAARKALTSLRASASSPSARANAEYALLRLDAVRGVTPELSRQFLDLAGKYPTEFTGSGAPLSDLSLLMALRSPTSGALAQLSRQVRERPSFLTPELFEAVKDLSEVQALKTTWASQEKTLALLRALVGRMPDPGRPGEIWVDLDAERFLALCDPAGNGWQVSLAPASLVERAFADALKENPARLPGYAAAAAELGGRRWIVAGTRSGATLASVAGRLEIRAAHPFTFNLELGAPELLYAPYRRRQWLTAALVLLAAATALLGLASLWRNFQRQVRLGEMKSNFVSSVSHELRAPIAAVRLMAESLDGGRITGEPKQKEYLRLIVQECRRLTSLVENVLDFSRIDQGRKQYSFEPVEPAALVEQTAALMEPGAALREVRVGVAGLPPEASGLQPLWDGEAVKQALVNLLDNAIKHSPAGAEVKIELEVAGEAIRIWVADRGEGIPASDQARIFELFYRRGSELRRETQGVGIGLSIVRHIVEAHGGRVLVESAVGKGSRFALELPLAAPESSK